MSEREINGKWAIVTADQFLGEPGSLARQQFALLAKGSELVVIEIAENEESAIRKAGEMTIKDWETQHDDGELFRSKRVKPGTKYNFAFSSEVHTA